MAKQNEEESVGFTYDVFLSFRGKDVRNTFVGHLRNQLSRRGIKTFYDDRDLTMGEGIAPSLSNAIEKSQILIIVFSKNYASSTWCLEELVKILYQFKIKKQLVFPIFYHVDPSDIRHQRNSYAEAMIAHENHFGKDSQKVQAWRSALTEASNFPGQHITTGYEINFIEEIVEKVYTNIAPKPFHTGQNPVGLGPRIEKVNSLLDMKPNDQTVRMLGIYGLGGVGKTELAKALYNDIMQHFDAATFLADVREKSNKINGIEDLQKTLLSEMRVKLDNELGSTSQGMDEIKRNLHRKKVLLVLDDVDDKNKLEKLAGGCDWFGSGSRIIITTRDKDMLIAHQVEKTYEMTQLDEQHCLELFCWNAFQQSHPTTGFEELSLRAVGVAKYLPLAIKVIGSDLATLPEESLDSWECALKEYERTPPNKRIQDVLKISFDRLDRNAKEVFLDIACFFKGKKEEYVKKILEEFGPTSNINVLVNKSLLTIEDGILNMHDLIQDMGREIVRQESPNPGKRSRLWYHEDVLDILTDDLGSDKIQGIMLDPPKREKVDWSGTAFQKMNRLRILIIQNTSFSSEPKHLPNHLRLLDWEGYPSKSFPPQFYPKKITDFKLRKSNLTFEEPFKKYSFLTNMDFSYNQSITEMPDVSKVLNLRELRLDHCTNLIAIHESVGFLKRLTHLSVSECTNLKNFLPRMFLPSLKVLNLNSCVRLEYFPEIIKEMNKPLKIYMINTAIQELPESIGNLTGLVCIDISNSRKLKYIPSSLFMLPNVVAFKIEGCSLLQESFRSFLQSPLEANVNSTLQKLDFGNGNLSDGDLLAILNWFPKLEELIVSENNFVSLPACIKECNHLTSLDANHCRELQKIPECSNLRILDVHHCYNLEEISELPSTIQKVDARYCSGLTRETSDMLWCQVKKRIPGIEVVMPFKTEIPEWFDFVDNGGNPRFWARGKFPNIALAMVFQFQDESERAELARRRPVDLCLLINGGYVPRKGYYKFRIEADHVLICDLRLLVSDKEWLGLEHEWNLVQVLYETTCTLTLSRWGAFVYKEGANMEDVQFMRPDPKYSNISSTIDRIEDPKQEDKMMIGMKGYFVAPQPPSFPDNRLVEPVRNTFVGEASTSGHQGSNNSENDPQRQEIMRKIFYDGMTDELVEARNSFPSLDIDKTRSAAALNKGNSHRVVSTIPGGGYPPPLVEMKMYVEGIVNELLEAKLRTLLALAQPPPTIPQLDWTTVIPPPASGDPLLQTFMMNKQQGTLESDVNSKLFWKIKEEHQAPRNKFVQLENATPDKDSDAARSWKNQYDELIKKFNTQSDAKKLDCTGGLKSASSSTEVHTDNGCKCETKYEKVGAVLKGKAEKLGRLYDAGVEGFQKSEEFEDLMSAIYFNGLRDGLLDAQAILLALHMDTKTEERVIDEVAIKENPVVVDIPSPTDPDCHNPIRDTYNPSGSLDFFNWQEFV